MNPDFSRLLSIINNKSFQDVANWPSFQLEDIGAHKSALGNSSGIYALFNNQSCCLYVGKAEILSGRLHSHYKATQGKETAPNWKQFFEYFNSEITARYYFVKDISDTHIEYARQALERIIQINCEPLFDKIYGKGHHQITDAEFDNLLNKYPIQVI